MIVVYIGDIQEYLAKLACIADPTASLITDENINNITPGTYYTSLGDLGNPVNLGIVLRSANKIIYAPPPGDWSDTKFGKSAMKTWTEDYLKIFRWRIPIENFNENFIAENKINMLTLADTRKSDHPQIWSVGCSISHGCGVEPAQRYGQLLANELGLSASFLTQGGSSIIWAADQILRSDLRTNDIVIWGITSHTRLPYFNDTLIHVNTQLYSKNPRFNDEVNIDLLDSEDTLYRSVICINQVINYCAKIKVKLFLAVVLDDVLINYIKDFPNIIMLYKLWGRNNNQIFEDIGDDDLHPGVNTHKFYANEILQKMKELDK
jgi:hypothetical protein